MRITGCLVKYETPLNANGRGVVVNKGAFKDQDGRKIPVAYNFEWTDPDYLLGNAVLSVEDDGVYIDALVDTEKFNNIMNMLKENEQSMLDNYHLGMYVNHLIMTNDKPKRIINGTIRGTGLVRKSEGDESSYLTEISEEDAR